MPSGDRRRDEHALEAVSAPRAPLARRGHGRRGRARLRLARPGAAPSRGGRGRASAARDAATAPAAAARATGAGGCRSRYAKSQQVMRFTEPLHTVCPSPCQQHGYARPVARHRTTIRELAEYTGLSPAAVSYALRGLQVSADPSGACARPRSSSATRPILSPGRWPGARRALVACSRGASATLQRGARPCRPAL